MLEELTRSIPESSTDLKYSGLPYYSETIRQEMRSKIEQREREIASLVGDCRADQPFRSNLYTGLGVGDKRLDLQCSLRSDGLDNWQRNGTVPVAQDSRRVSSVLDIPAYSNGYYEQLVARINQSYIEARTITVPFRSVFDFGDSVSHNYWICGRCGKDVRYVAYCQPQLEAGRREYNFPPGTVVDANPNRQELTSGDRQEPSSEEARTERRPSSLAQLLDSWGVT